MDFKEFQQGVQGRNFPLPFPGHWVDGKWQRYGDTKPLSGSHNPNNGDLLIQPTTSKSVLTAALDSGERALQKTANLSLEDRLQYLERLRNALTDYRAIALHIMSLEGGKPAWEASDDFDAAIGFLDGVMKHRDKIAAGLTAPAALNLVEADFYRRPVGVTVGYLPFSSPIISFVSYVTGAFIAGSPLVLCPSAHAALSGLLYGYIAESLDLPKGMLAFAFGNFETFKKVLSDKRIQAIIYTGSREHCESIRRESRAVKGRQLILQSGGKNATLVHSSADIDHAVRCVIMGGYRAGGQLCTSTSRVFVHSSLAAPFCDALRDRVQALEVGLSDDGKEAKSPFLGPLYSRKAVDKFLQYQTMAHREAARDLLWGKTVEDSPSNCLVTPGLHLMKSFDRSSGYQSNVLFCPDIAVYEYEILDEAIAQINMTDAPFVVSYIGDEDIIQSRRQMFRAPNLLINIPTTAVENRPAIAGMLESGHHRYNGVALALLLSYPRLTQTSEQLPGTLDAYPL